MNFNLFRWLKEHPGFRVIGGWIFLIIIAFLDWVSGVATAYGPLYCLPVIMIGYDQKIKRGIVVAILAGAAWTLQDTSVGVSLWSGLGETHVSESIRQIPAPLQKELVRRGVMIRPAMDPMKQLPQAILLWAVGSAGFALVAWGFHTIRAQEKKIALAESERGAREKTLLNAITTTLNHEINNPLAIIAAQAGLMESESGADRKRMESFRHIQEAVLRISNFIKELSAIEEVRLKDMGSAYLHVDWQQAVQPPGP